MCAPKVQYIQIVALRMLTCILALDQETVATRFITVLGLAELHNVRDSVAPRSYVDSRSQAFSDSWAWLQG